MSQKSLRGVWKLMKQGGFFSSHQALGKYFVMSCYRFVWASRWASATLLAFSENPETRAQWSEILFEGALCVKIFMYKNWRNNQRCPNPWTHYQGLQTQELSRQRLWRLLPWIRNPFRITATFNQEPTSWPVASTTPQQTKPVICCPVAGASKPYPPIWNNNLEGL